MFVEAVIEEEDKKDIEGLGVKPDKKNEEIDLTNRIKVFGTISQTGN